MGDVIAFRSILSNARKTGVLLAARSNEETRRSATIAFFPGIRYLSLVEDTGKSRLNLSDKENNPPKKK